MSFETNKIHTEAELLDIRGCLPDHRRRPVRWPRIRSKHLEDRPLTANVSKTVRLASPTRVICGNEPYATSYLLQNTRIAMNTRFIRLRLHSRLPIYTCGGTYYELAACRRLLGDELHTTWEASLGCEKVSSIILYHMALVMQPIEIGAKYSYIPKQMGKRTLNIQGNPWSIRKTLVFSITSTLLASSKFNLGGNYIPPQASWVLRAYRSVQLKLLELIMSKRIA